MEADPFLQTNLVLLILGILAALGQYFWVDEDLHVNAEMLKPDRFRYIDDLLGLAIVIFFGLSVAYSLIGQGSLLMSFGFLGVTVFLIAFSRGTRIRFVASRLKRDPQQEAQEEWLRQGLMDFSEGVVREVMVPMRDVFTIGVESTVADVLADPEFTPYSRIPVWQSEPDNIVGLVYSKELLHAGLGRQEDQLRRLGIHTHMREPYFVPEVMEQVELLKEFQTRKVQMAIVVDEFGVSSGIVTLEDLMETVIGDMGDRRNDNEDMVQETGLRDWSLDAMIDLQSFSELVGREFESDLVETLGGYIFQHLGQAPLVGHKLVLQGLEFEILEMERYRIRKMRVRELRK